MSAVSGAQVSIRLLMETASVEVFVFLFPLAEESTLAAPGRCCRARGFPSAAPTFGRCLKALCKRLALPGGPGSLHHPWV